MTAIKDSIKARFMSLVEPEPNSGCWLWTGATLPRFGYGRFNFYSKNRLAHRVSFAIFVGEVAEGEWVLHKCDVPSCVNPEHLFLGSRADNSRDMAVKFRGVKSKTGLPFGVRLDVSEKHKSKPYVAVLWVKRKFFRLGHFETAAEACSVAVAAKMEALRKE